MAIPWGNDKNARKSKVLTGEEGWRVHAGHRCQRSRAGVQVSGRPLEARDSFPPVRWKYASIFRPGTGDTRGLTKDVDPAASPDGERRDCAADRPSSSAAESRVRSDGLGASAVSGARRAPKMGGRARPERVALVDRPGHSLRQGHRS